VVEELLLPSLALALIGWLVPRGLSLFWPEGVRPLLALGFVATLVMLVVSALFFLGFYILGGVPLDRLTEEGWGPAVAHFGRLAVISALIWGPILVLSVAGLPKHWVKETW
jgi:uncharacterized membrane protein